MEKYPIIIEDKQVGQLSVCALRLKTCFYAECEKREGIIRLAVFGGGKRAYLGVLAPRGDKLTLERSFTRHEMKLFPEKIEYAAPFNEPARKSKNEKTIGDAVWKRACDGAMYRMSGAQTVVALPVEDKRLLGRRFSQTTIDGARYAVLSPEIYRIIK